MASGITLAQAIQAFERETGCLGDRDLVVGNIAEAIEFVLQSGMASLLREWVIPVSAGRFTLPRDLESPIKYKWGCTNNGYGVFNSSYLSYSSTGVRNCTNYLDWSPEFELKPGRVATQFQPPKNGLRLVATTRNPEDVGCKIMVAGKQNGMQIAAVHNGQKTAGELLTVYLETDGNKKYSSFLFHEITSVVKDKTQDYVMLSGLENGSSTPYFLSHFMPDEEYPAYREVELHACPTFMNPASCDHQIHILGRINPSIIYERDEDALPITSLQMLKLLAKRAKYDQENSFQEVSIMEGRIFNIIKKERAYQEMPSRSLSINLASAGGGLLNI